MAEIFSPSSKGSNHKIAAGQHTSVTANDTIVTGLARVLFVVASFEDAPALTSAQVVAQIGNQSTAPAPGSIAIKTYQPTATGDGTPIAATGFGKKINWMALGY
jgi:hypothetical protein